jgi:hypothetical protein
MCNSQLAARCCSWAVCSFHKLKTTNFIVRNVHEVYFLTNKLWIRVLEKVIVAQLVIKFTSFYGARFKKIIFSSECEVLMAVKMSIVIF